MRIRQKAKGRRQKAEGSLKGRKDERVKEV
jgi:hypothetical protein